MKATNRKTIYAINFAGMIFISLILIGVSELSPAFQFLSSRNWHEFHRALLPLSYILLLGLSLLLFLELQKVQPTTKELGHDVARPLPFVIRMIDAILDGLPFTPWDVMDPAILLKKGARDAGLPTNYSSDVVEAIETLCCSLKNNNVQLHWIGRW